MYGAVALLVLGTGVALASAGYQTSCGKRVMGPDQFFLKLMENGKDSCVILMKSIVAHVISKVYGTKESTL